MGVPSPQINGESNFNVVPLLTLEIGRVDSYAVHESVVRVLCATY